MHCLSKGLGERKQDFVIEEDGDSGHGPGKSNIVRTWKQEHGLEFYFNCHNSPDLAPIENYWLQLQNHHIQSSRVM